jgi:hypothetical protein
VKTRIDDMEKKAEKFEKTVDKAEAANVEMRKNFQLMMDQMGKATAKFEEACTLEKQASKDMEGRRATVEGNNDTRQDVALDVQKTLKRLADGQERLNKYIESMNSTPTGQASYHYPLTNHGVSVDNIISGKFTPPTQEITTPQCKDSSESTSGDRTDYYDNSVDEEQHNEAVNDSANLLSENEKNKMEVDYKGETTNEEMELEDESVEHDAGKETNYDGPVRDHGENSLGYDATQSDETNKTSNPMAGNQLAFQNGNVGMGRGGGLSIQEEQRINERENNLKERTLAFLQDEPMSTTDERKKRKLISMAKKNTEEDHGDGRSKSSTDIK